MNKEEIIKFLKDNLKLNIQYRDPVAWGLSSVPVIQLKIGDEIISELDLPRGN